MEVLASVVARGSSPPCVKHLATVYEEVVTNWSVEHFQQIVADIRQHGYPYLGIGFTYAPYVQIESLSVLRNRASEIVRVIVRERCPTPAESVLKQSPSLVDFIGSCCTACVGV